MVSMQWSQNNGSGGKVTSEYPTVKFFLAQILFAGIIVMAFSFRSYAQTAAEPGGIIEKDMPLHVSNVAFYDPSSKKGIRVGFTFDKDGKKMRINKKSGKEI